MRCLLPLILLLSLLLGACSPGKRDYSRWENLPASGWVYGDTVLLLPVDTMLLDNDSIVEGAVGLPWRKFGRWLGSGFGASYQNSAMINQSTVIDVTRPVEVRHIMRVDTLHGIDQIGIFVSHN